MENSLGLSQLLKMAPKLSAISAKWGSLDGLLAVLKQMIAVASNLGTPFLNQLDDKKATVAASGKGLPACKQWSYWAVNQYFTKARTNTYMCQFGKSLSAYNWTNLKSVMGDVIFFSKYPTC